MEATQIKFEAQEAAVTEENAMQPSEALRELSALELSLVGGGTIAVAFF